MSACDERGRGVGGGAVLEISWRIGGGGGAPCRELRLAALLRDGGGVEWRAECVEQGRVGVVESEGEGAWEEDRVDGRVHVDAGDALRATLSRARGGGWDVVYAHTGALARLGVGGGQASAPTARVVSDASTIAV